MIMTRYGYFLSCEEYGPTELVRQARLAEEAGFEALWISDHFHPWLDEQGQAGFVWSVIGAISHATSLPVTTAVTCPLMRQHPAIVAQAAATSALLTGNRFTLGVGSGEALNEHIFGDGWPSAEERLDMLEEAVHVIRDLFSGQLVSHYGKHYTVETARLYSMPDEPPPIYMSGFGDKAVKLAARIADGYMCVQPNSDFVRLFRESGGGDRPVQGGLKVAWHTDAGQARKAMHRLWPTDVIPGESAQLLPLPRHFGQLAQLVSEDMISAPCGPDPAAHVDGVRAFTEAGFNEVYVGQVGGETEGFFEFYAKRVLPRLREG
jgi:G6PDH family F420-dependent oxidoreductase